MFIPPVLVYSPDYLFHGHLLHPRLKFSFLSSRLRHKFSSIFHRDVYFNTSILKVCIPLINFQIKSSFSVCMSKENISSIYLCTYSLI